MLADGRNSMYVIRAVRAIQAIRTIGSVGGVDDLASGLAGGRLAVK